ncbi:hypothetical protein KVV02_003510 [Mortierella alpina]|uniref:Asparaginase n=1 Tax=Mortierella alpina TaxID=64518 RepID=A0A9P7ZYL4_MORAP|nr:hypothetical protein KVV02_003510 [Mortierella alpina]
MASSLHQDHNAGFVAVHVGAGLHAARNKTRYLDACRKACQAGTVLLRTDPTATCAAVVEHMIRILEDDPVTNAGIGSNLNLDGRVECDASIMNGTTLGFGSVGAVSEFKNPISVAAKVLEESDKGPLSLGRIPPTMLVGSGAGKWADTMDFALDRVQSSPYIPPTTSGDLVGGSSSGNMGSPINGSLVTHESLQYHLRFQEMLRNASTKEVPSKREAKEEEPSCQQQTEHSSTKRLAIGIIEDELLQDTVGAICVDRFGRVASGVSSGGIAMKFPGRVSEAAIFGAGCWAQDASETSAGFACSMTGAGEQICKTLLAKSCMETMVSEDDDTASAANTVLDHFMNNPLLRSYGEKHAGFIAAKVDPLGSDPNVIDSTATSGGCGAYPAATTAPVRGDFVIAHTTKTMGVAYMSTRDERPKAMMSLRKPGLNKAVFIAAMRGQ